MKQEKSSDWNIKNAKTQSREVYIALRLCVYLYIEFRIFHLHIKKRILHWSSRLVEH